MSDGAQSNKDTDPIIVVHHRIRIGRLGAVTLVAVNLCLRMRTPLPLADGYAQEFVGAVTGDGGRLGLREGSLSLTRQG